jgi:hypothetical protein
VELVPLGTTPTEVYAHHVYPDANPVLNSFLAKNVTMGTFLMEFLVMLALLIAHIAIPRNAYLAILGM